MCGNNCKLLDKVNSDLILIQECDISIFYKNYFFLCPTIFNNNNSNKFNPKKLQVLSRADFISRIAFAPMSMLCHEENLTK